MYHIAVKILVHVPYDMKTSYLSHAILCFYLQDFFNHPNVSVITASELWKTCNMKEILLQYVSVTIELLDQAYVQAIVAFLLFDILNKYNF